MTFKKTLYLIGAFLITSFVLFFYFSFTGNPISKAIAKKHAIEYLDSQFPNNNYAIQDSTFNFKDDEYYFQYTLTAHNDRVYHYSVGVGTGLNPNRIMSNTIHYDSENVDMTSNFSDTGTSYVKNLLKNNNFQGDIYYYVQVPIDYLEKDAKWTPHLEFPVEAEITIISEQHFESKKQFIKYVNSVMDVLNDVKFNQLYVENRYEDDLIYTINVKKGQTAQIENLQSIKR